VCVRVGLQIPAGVKARAVSLDPIPLQPTLGTTPRLVAIGNFDGVHRGHRALLEQLTRDAAASGLIPTVMTFAPHPAVVLGRPALPSLTTLAEKCELLAAAAPGLQVVVQPFDLELARMAPVDFVEQILVQKYHAQRVIVGENFRFGAGRAGDLSTLVALGSRFGFTASPQPLLKDEVGVISSSRIRGLIAEGDVSTAARLLGRDYTLSGSVTTGRQLARTLGFPTANLTAVQQLLPKSGVYACRVHCQARDVVAWPAVCNLGTRPTVDGVQFAIEPHLLDFAGDLYGTTLEVAFLARLRDERRFDGLEQLKAQIASDVAQARGLLEQRPAV
jgi:riboflavin kinase / FMN adenylyltransferase